MGNSYTPTGSPEVQGFHHDSESTEAYRDAWVKPPTVAIELRPFPYNDWIGRRMVVFHYNWGSLAFRGGKHPSEVWVEAHSHPEWFRHIGSGRFATLRALRGRFPARQKLVGDWPQL